MRDFFWAFVMAALLVGVALWTVKVVFWAFYL